MESDAHVGLAAWRAHRRDLADVAFTVVDIETTGATPGFCKTTEIGAVRIEGGREVSTFSALVNPGMHIPTFITGITGIDDETVAGSPPIDVVLPRFVDFAAHSVLVARRCAVRPRVPRLRAGQAARADLPAARARHPAHGADSPRSRSAR